MMFFKTTLATVVASLGVIAVAGTALPRGLLAPGNYIISSVGQNRALTSNGNNVYLSRTSPTTGAYSTWIVRDSVDAANKISNVGANKNVTAGTGVNGSPVNLAVVVKEDASHVITFAIQPAGNNEWVIKRPYDDLVWTMEVQDRSGTAIPVLRGANGSPAQRFTFKAVH